MERPRTRLIYASILDHVCDDGTGVARRVARAYGISRQAANRHLDELVGEGLLIESGSTRAKRYELRSTGFFTREFRITPVLNADRVWDDHAAPVVAGERKAIQDLCRAAFGELVRNATAHAGGAWLSMALSMTARHIDLSVSDDGRGIFALLALRFGVGEPRAAAEELARRAQLRAVDHPAARLVLLARNFESFAIRSSGVEVAYDSKADAWIARDAEPAPGTTVMLRCRREARGSAHTSLPPRQRSIPRRRRGPLQDRAIRS